jgi:Domain of unknown function (DUF4386)
MKTATLDRSVEPTTAKSVATVSVTAPSLQPGGSTDTSTKTAVLVGLCFLAATFTFAVGNALIHSHSSSATVHDGLLAGVFLLGCCGLAVAANGAAMRRILTPYAPIRSRAYFVLRLTECLILVVVGAYFLTSHAQWNEYVLAVYAVSGVAGLVLSSALLTSRIVPRNLSMLGVIGYPVFLVGSIFAMLGLIDVTNGVGMLALVLGGLFELLLPIWLFTKGFTFQRIED